MRGVVVMLLAGVALACGTQPGLLDDVAIAWANHREVTVEDDQVVPVLFGNESVSICLEAPAARDTSGWRARLRWRVADTASFGDSSGESSGEVAIEPSRRMGPTLCFSTPAPSATGRIALCGELRDLQTGQTTSLPCHSMRRQPSRAASHQALSDAMRRAWGAGDPGEILARIDTVATRARDEDFLVLATRAELAAVHYLVQVATPTALDAASGRLDAMPSWLDRPEVHALAAQAAYQRARLGLAGGWRLARAWDDLKDADRHYVRIASSFRLVAPTAQAGLLARLGGLANAVTHLSSAVAACADQEGGGSVCDPFLVNQAHANASFWTLLDPTADDMALAQAEAFLRRALDDTPDSLPGERANHLVNLGLAQVRQARDPTPFLVDARGLLAGETEVGAARVAELMGWVELVRGLGALETGDAEAALRTCGELAAAEPTPRLAAWALDCVARAHRRRGALDAAADAYQRLFDFFEYATPEALGQDVPLGPSQRADAFYRAVRVAVERGQADVGWALLDRLDNVSASESARRACRDQLVDPELIRAWQALDARREVLSRDLLALERPASIRRQRQQDSIARDLRAELDELLRTWPGCVRSSRQPVATMVDFRALAVDDEVLLLHRTPGGQVIVDHRTPMSRKDLQRAVAALASALVDRDLDDNAWRRQAMTVARAIVPSALETLDDVASFGLYGFLQGVPLAALPVPGAPERWLGDVMRPVIVPVGIADATRPARPTPPGEPLFVVDPSRNLAAAATIAPWYREQFATATHLRGDGATRAAVLSALPTASFLHVDAHVVFEVAFPTLSNIVLTDAPLRMMDFDGLDLSLAFANLSGCDSGRWPVTADRGRYGIGGLLTRVGVPWVIASRATLDDALAGAFNRAFYQAIGRGDAVPDAYTAAMTAVRGRFPAAAWGAFQLLRGPLKAAGEAVVDRDSSFFRRGGQTRRVMTPTWTREMR